MSVKSKLSESGLWGVFAFFLAILRPKNSVPTHAQAAAARVLERRADNRPPPAGRRQGGAVGSTTACHVGRAAVGKRIDRES